ncbi:MAG: peptidylprolyl isomerase [Dehalococcoidia bacterium]|nr:peptidylprolyl isomerase [Dehalococcoidia bacterium]
MPKKRRQAKIPTPAWERPRGAIGSRILGRGGQFYGAVAVGVLIAVALGVIGYAFLSDYVDKQRRPGSTAIQVEDTHFRLDYFSSRLKMYVGQFGGQGADAAQPASALPAVADTLIQEEIVLRFAGELKVTANEQEVTEGIASRIGVKTDDPNFTLSFQQEVVRSQLSEDEYRRMVEASVLADKLRTEFEKQVPTTADSAHFRQILVGSDAKAQETRDKLEAGEDFAAVAAENSLDTATKDTGGDVGWVPKGVLDASLEELIFALNPKELTTIPIAQGVFVVEMLEKDAAHAVEDAQKSSLAIRALQDWVEEKKKSVNIVNNMDLGGGDSNKIEWAVSRAYQS